MRTDHRGNPINVARFVAQPSVIALTTTSAALVLKANTAYALWTDADCYFQFGDGGVVATSNSHPLKAGQDRQQMTDDVNSTVAALVGSGGGHLYISELDFGF